MSDSRSSQVTQILQDIAGGDLRSAERLLPCVYRELRALARALLSRVPIEMSRQGAGPGRSTYPWKLHAMGTKPETA